MPMPKPIVIITGASGFLGSAICIDLAQDSIVIAIDCREPSEQLKKAAPTVIWHTLDINDNENVSKVFSLTRKNFGQIDFVIHFAAYYDFGNDWVEEYQRTNVDGMANIIDASKNEGVKRLIFASSIAAMEPPAYGSFLTEESPTSEVTPYAKSKTIGERLLAETNSQLPSTILRIAGVFSDWCELPPLHSLIKLWTSSFPLGSILPGRGETGIPYIHIADLVFLIRKCILLDHELEPSNVFLASQRGAVLHQQLFHAISSHSTHSRRLRPIHVPRKIAKFGVSILRSVGELSGNVPFERPWMMDYVDRPWTIDTSETRQILDWDCAPELGILVKIADILENLQLDPKGWKKRNIARNERRYSYSGL
jgi:nucleoside-diphosphate-sugar epimerase